MRAAPGRISQPSLDAADGRPKAPAIELADDQASAGFEHARHFLDRSVGVADKAEHGDREYELKGAVTERQKLGASTDETEIDTRGTRPRRACGQHGGVGVDAGHSGPALRRLDGECAVARAHVEHAKATQSTGGT
jgi:hypothetical protein